MNTKLKKTILAAAALLLIASGCSEKDENNTGNNAENDIIAEQQDQTNNNNVGEDEAGNDHDADNGEADDTNGADSGSDEANGTNEDSNPELNEDAEEVTAQSIANEIIAQIEMGRLLPLQGEQIKDLYGINADELIEDGVFMPAMMNVHAYELTIVKLKSDEHYEAINLAMEQRAQSIQKTFEQYLPDQYEASKNYQIIRNGDYVLFSITPDQQKVVEIFESLI